MVSQSQFLNKILQTKDFSIVIKNNLTKEYFFNYTAEFLFIKNHFEQYGNVPDEITFLNTFPDFDCYKVSEPDNYLLEQLIRDFTQNDIATDYNQIRRYIESDQIEEANKLRAQVSNKIYPNGSISSVDLVTDTSRYQRFIERQDKPNGGYLGTGFVELDKITGGIDRENEDMVIVARTGKGKSWSLLKMAVSAVQAGLKVGMYSGEMSLDKVGYRFDTLMGHVNNKGIMRGQTEVTPEYKSYIDNIGNIAAGGHFYVITPAEVSGPVTVDVLRGFIAKNELDILFIDQYSLLEDTSRAKTSFEQVANISKAVKNLQVKSKIPIISVAQQNRTKNEDKSLDTTQIGLSDRIGQDATTVIMLDREDNDLILHIVKARDGGEGHKLRYNCDFNRGIFQYIPQEDDGQTSEEAYQDIAASYEMPSDTFDSLESLTEQALQPQSQQQPITSVEDILSSFNLGTAPDTPF